MKGPCFEYISLLKCVVVVVFVAIRPKSTAMVMEGRSAHLTTLFLGKLEEAVNRVLRAHTFACN